jgi:hypothetical protein
MDTRSQWVDSHGCHLGQTQEHQKEPSSDDEEPPDQTGGSPIGQALCQQARQSVIEPKVSMDGIRQNNFPRGDQRAAKSYDGDVSEVTLQGQLRCISHNNTKGRTRKTCSLPRALISAWSAWVPRHLGATCPLDGASSARVLLTVEGSLFQGILACRRRQRRIGIKNRG